MGIKGLLLGLCSAMLFSCDNCNDDCKPSLTIDLEVTNSAGKNLFAQPDPVLSFDSVKIIAVYANFVYNVPVEFYEREGKTLITFSPGNTEVREHIIKYSSTESDTLEFTNYVYDKSDCCQMVKHYDLQLNHQSFCAACKDEIITIIK
jgi:hypothetical protein